MDTQEIRRGLRNIKTRSATIDAVAHEGQSMVEAVLPLLQDRNEGVRWSTIRILSEIGDERTIGPLITLLEQRKNVTEAVNTLRAVTNQEFGDDFGSWQEWATQEPELRNAAALGFLSDSELMEAATKDISAVVSGKEQEYVVNVSLEEGRAQQVWIDFSRKDLSGESIVQLSTPCGDADEHQYEAALKLNMSIPYGAIAIAELDDSVCFVVVDTYLRRTAHPEDIAKSIISLARHGDSVEESLSGEDKF